MSKPVVLFGTGDIAELAWFCLTQDAHRQVVGFTLDKAYVDKSEFRGLPVVPFEDVQERFPPEEHEMLIAVGMADVNRLRARKCSEAVEKGYSLTSYISSRAMTFPDFSCGPNCFIGSGNTIQPFARLGANVMLVANTYIGHHVVIEDDCLLGAGAVVAGQSSVGRGTFIGANATIRDHVRIGRHCIVGAGCLLLNDAPDFSVFRGPAAEPAAMSSRDLRRL